MAARCPSTTWRSPARRCAPAGPTAGRDTGRSAGGSDRVIVGASWRGYRALSRGARSMRGWDALRVARAAGARLVGEPSRAGRERGPRRATIDSREVAPGDLFVGLRGEHADGGAYAAEALEAGAWGVLVTPAHATVTLDPSLRTGTGGVVLAHPDPLAGLQALARAWRRELGSGRDEGRRDHRLDRQDLDQGHPGRDPLGPIGDRGHRRRKPRSATRLLRRRARRGACARWRAGRT